MTIHPESADTIALPMCHGGIISQKGAKCLNFLNNIAKGHKYGFFATLGKIIVACKICKNKDLSDEKVKYLTKMMS